MKTSEAVVTKGRNRQCGPAPSKRETPGYSSRRKVTNAIGGGGAEGEKKTEKIEVLSRGKKGSRHCNFHHGPFHRKRKMVLEPTARKTKGPNGKNEGVKGGKKKLKAINQNSHKSISQTKNNNDELESRKKRGGIWIN